MYLDMVQLLVFSLHCIFSSFVLLFSIMKDICMKTRFLFLKSSSAPAAYSPPGHNPRFVTSQLVSVQMIMMSKTGL